MEAVQFKQEDIWLATQTGQDHPITATTFIWEGMKFAIHRGIGSESEKVIITHVASGLAFKQKLDKLFEYDYQAVYDAWIAYMPLREKSCLANYGKGLLVIMRECEQEPMKYREQAIKSS